MQLLFQSCFLVLWLVLPAVGDDWASSMFNETNRDFGIVARGTEVKCQFFIENKLKKDIRIASIQSHCGCSTFRLSKSTIKPGEKAELNGSLDTRSFLGNKVITIGVIFDSPMAAEVQLQLKMFIRSDIMLEPGGVQFGLLNPGDTSRQTVSIRYTGRNDWRIVKVESGSSFLQSQIIETSRNNNQVAYDLVVSLKSSAPEGYIKEPIYLVTNDRDPKASRISVMVEGLITSRVRVQPNPLFLGIVEAGKTASRSLVIQSPTPFRILAIKTSDTRWKCDVPQENKSWHVLKVSFSANHIVGKALGKIRIETDQAEVGPFDVDASIQVTPEKNAVGN